MLQTVAFQTEFWSRGGVSSPQGNATNQTFRRRRRRRNHVFAVSSPQGNATNPPHYYLILGVFILCVFRQ